MYGLYLYSQDCEDEIKRQEQAKEARKKEQQENAEVKLREKKTRSLSPDQVENYLTLRETN